MSSVTALQFEQERLTQVLEGLEQQRRVMEKAFLKCRRDREIVENAIAVQRETYENDRSRREQTSLDDEILQRLTRNRQNDR